MRRVQISVQAIRDLEEISDYISRDNPEAARSVILHIRDKCELLAEQPGIGRNRSDLVEGLRSLAVGNFVIFYQSSGKGIEVVRVLHGARDIPELFGAD